MVEKQSGSDQWIEQPDGRALYNEGCNALRHYSLCVMNTRALTIAQGFVILTASTYLIKEERYVPSLFVSFFGIAFTVVLSSLQKNYWLHFTAILDTVVDEIEAKRGPWSAYRVQRNDRHKKPLWKTLVIDGPFILLSLALVTLVVYALLKLKKFIS